MFPNCKFGEQSKRAMELQGKIDKGHNAPGDKVSGNMLQVRFKQAVMVSSPQVGADKPRNITRLLRYGSTISVVSSLPICMPALTTAAEAIVKQNWNLRSLLVASTLQLKVVIYQ